MNWKGGNMHLTKFAWPIALGLLAAALIGATTVRVRMPVAAGTLYPAEPAELGALRRLGG